MEIVEMRWMMEKRSQSAGRRTAGLYVWAARHWLVSNDYEWPDGRRHKVRTSWANVGDAPMCKQWSHRYEISECRRAVFGDGAAYHSPLLV